MSSFTVIVEHCPDTNLFVAYVPGFPGVHSQGETLVVQRSCFEKYFPERQTPIKTAESGH
jgi:hypothetical protein